MSIVRLRLPHSWLLWGVVLGLFAGCQNQPPSNTPTSTSSTTSPSESSPVSDPATDMLSSAIFQVQPENLGIDSNPTSAVAVLNSWREQTALIKVDNFGFNRENLQEYPESLLSEAQRDGMLATEFFPADSMYIRNAILTAAISRVVADRYTNELGRVMALFDYTLRTVVLQPTVLSQMPLPLYQILILGQGTADDRAWVYATLLKQQRIDAVILQSRENPDLRLFGVLLDGEVYLFDFQLGLPIPRGDDPPSIRIPRPATYKEMLAHPDWWQALTIRADQPYPWNSDQLAAADVFLISQEESWSGRMKQLESVLPTNSLCVLYDPLFDTPTIPSLLHRVAAVNSEWTPEKLKFWSHPLDVTERAKMMGQQAQNLRLVFQRFNVPWEVKSSKHKNVVTDAELAGRSAEPEIADDDPNARILPTLRHLKTRTEQLMGKYAEATAHYLRIRHLAVETPPEQLFNKDNPQEFQFVNVLYKLAATDASFWSAECKIEMDDPVVAAQALQDFLRKYPRSDWSSAARYVLALVQAQKGDLPAARDAIATLAPDDPHRPGMEVLLKRWEGLSPTKSTNEPKSETPASEKESREAANSEASPPADASSATSSEKPSEDKQPE